MASESNLSLVQLYHMTFSSVPNRRACTFISGKVCLLASIEDKRQTLPEINEHAHLFGTLE